MSKGLNDLPLKTPARIAHVGELTDSPYAPGELETRLLEVGFEEGAIVEVRHRAPFGDPISVMIENRQISLRLAEAAAVQVEPVTP